MGRFDGKVAIVTGASSGIGEATALAFAKEGASLTITGRNQGRLSAVAEKCRKHGAKVLEVICEMCDVDTLEPVITRSVDTYGGIDILVNNAGAIVMGPVEQLQVEDFDKIIQVNIRAPMFLCKYALPHLRKTKGCIVNTSSTLSEVCYPNCVLYCMTKAALDHFTRGFASECAGDGVRVNCINPGIVVTRIFDSQLSEDESDAARNELLKGQPLGPLQGDDIADGILYLCEAKGTTGTSLFVDGGLKLQ